MSRTYFDEPLVLRPSGSPTITTNGATTPLAAPLGALPLTAWYVDISALVAPPIVSISLEVATSSAGPWTVVSTISPTGRGGVQLGVSTSLVRTLVPQAAWVRCAHTTQGPNSLQYASALAPMMGGMGLAARPRDTPVVA
jgi:hypothetical protein